MSAKKLKVAVEPKLLKLDFGCGPNPREGFEGVDIRSFDGKAKHVLNLVEKNTSGQFIRKTPYELFKKWPWADNSVEEAHSSHFIEHLDQMERVHFVNELYRVLIPGGKALIIAPHWSSCRAYGDMTHKWPPVSEFWFFYLDKAWRAINAPHNDFYTCDFNVGWGYSLDNESVTKNQETQQFRMQHYKDVCQDIVVTFTKK